MAESPASSSGARILSFLLGLIFGGGAAAAGFFAYNQKQQRDFEAQVAELQAKLAIQLPGKLLDQALNQVDQLGGLLPGVNPQPTAPVKPPIVSDEVKVIEVGKGFIADIERSRFASAYATMSSEYQKKTDRKAFDAMIAKFPGVRRLNAGEYTREQKTRKTNDKTFQFYFTGRDENGSLGKNLVNFALTITKDSDEWRVDDLEITAEK